jgi:hypothetical protein
MTLLTVCDNPTGTETNGLVDEITRTWSNPRFLKFLIPQLDPEPSLRGGRRTETGGYTLKSRTAQHYPWARCKVPGNCGTILRISNVKGSYARYKSRRVFPECGVTYTWVWPPHSRKSLGLRTFPYTFCCLQHTHSRRSFCHPCLVCPHYHTLP